MTSTATIMCEAKAYAKTHLVECCREIIEWQETSILRPGGKVRELADVVRPVVDHGALAVAETLVKRAAMEFVAEHAHD